jgi:ubiquinone/menaquinone biosynthesis C-methylase UbiE
VVEELIAGGRLNARSRVLDVGCGTGNYAAALSERVGCRVSGVEPSAQMRARARNAVSWETLAEGRGEDIPFPDASFDLVFSTDVIHHVGDRPAYFREATRVLRPGGQIATATDSHDDIPKRRPLSSHFPETVLVEQRRYPGVPRLLDEMAGAGFVDPRLVQVSHNYQLTDLQAYRDKVFSSLHVIDEEAFARGIARLEADLASGPIPCVSLYTVIWATKPGAQNDSADPVSF